MPEFPPREELLRKAWELYQQAKQALTVEHASNLLKEAQFLATFATALPIEFDNDIHGSFDVTEDDRP